MTIVGTMINAFVVVAVGSVLAWITVERTRQVRRELETKLVEQAEKIVRLEAKVETQLAATDARMDAGLVGLQARMDAGFGAMQARMDAGFLTLQARMDAGFGAMQDRMDRMINGVRSDLTAVALAVGVPQRPQPA